MSEDRSAGSFRFGVFELSRTTGSLLRNGVPVRLPPQPAQVLLLLVGRAGEVVTREEIQQLTWADDTVVDFDVGINRCIRRIRSALLDNADAPRYLETVPRVGYRFIAPVQAPAPAPTVAEPLEVSDPPGAGHKAAGWRMFAGLGLLFAVVLAGVFWSSRNRRENPTDLHTVPLAVSFGDQFTPTFSPDGHQVAFTWNGEEQDNFDIYVKLVNSSAPTLRLTTNKDVDYSPAWSPDGQWIAFCRGTDTRGGAIWLVPALGGAERKLVDLNELGSPWNRSIAWSRDSKKLVISAELAGRAEKGLHLVDIDTGVTKQLTRPFSPDFDMYPAVSPDGETVAFTRDIGRGVSRILVMPLTGGSARPIALPQSRSIYNARPAWTPDGSHLVFVSNAGGNSHVWLSPAHTSAAPRELAAVGDGIQDVAVSSIGQLGIVHQGEDSNLWMIDPHGSDRPFKPKRIFASTRMEESPAVRPDGKQIAFASNRSGYGEIWTGRTDGSDAMQITFLQNPVTGSPDWSPDGRRIVFDSREGERPQLYVVSADGGKVEPLQSGMGLSVVPRWSPDGHFVYFSSDRTGRMEVWRVPSGGGTPQQITKEGGFAPIPVRDGSAIYYSSDNAPVTSLWKLQVATGERTPVAPSVLRRAYAPAADGVYFFSGSTSETKSSLFFLGKHSPRPVLVFSTDRRIGNGITLAPDERKLYYTQLDVSERQLLLVQNFWK